MEVIIKIKSPSASYNDLELECNASDTVIMLKQRIAQDFPTKPPVSGQKLVYSGKILKDSDILDNVLRFEDECQKFTFHLVCAMPHKKIEEHRSSQASIPQQQQPEPSFPDGVRQRSVQGNVETTPGVDMNQMMQEFSSQYTEAIASMTNNPTEADIAAMQQLYNQYVSVYMQYMQSQSWDQQQAAAAQMFFPPAAGAGGQENGREAAPPADQVDAGAGAGMVMNAGGPGAAAGQIQEAQGGDRQRDLLDWVYVMTRVMLLVSVIYFHSSFLRLAFVVGVGFFAYFYQNRVRQMRIQRQRQEQQQRQHRAEQQLQQQENTNEDASDASNDEEAEEAEDIVTEEQAPSKLSVFLTFCTTFVTSLMPENPQVI